VDLDITTGGKISQVEMENAKLKLSGDFKAAPIKKKPNTLKLKK